MFVYDYFSIELDPAKMADACKNGQPPMDMMFYNEEKPGYFKIFEKKTMKWFPKTFATDAFMQIHMIQAYVDAEKNKIIFDTCETPKGDIMMGKYREMN
jgi:carotenoid cleavage dioxygenase-like enzyme